MKIEYMFHTKLAISDCLNLVQTFMNAPEEYWSISNRSGATAIFKRLKRPYPLPKWAHSLVGLVLFPLGPNVSFWHGRSEPLSCHEECTIIVRPTDEGSTVTISASVGTKRIGKLLHRYLSDFDMHLKNGSGFPQEPSLFDDRVTATYVLLPPILLLLLFVFLSYVACLAAQNCSLPGTSFLRRFWTKVP